VIASDRFLRTLCWTLVVVVIAAALLNLVSTLDILVARPDIPDDAPLGDRLLAFRAFDQQSNTIWLVSNVVQVVVFVLAVLIAVALLPYAPSAAAGMLILVLFVLAGVVGVVGSLVNIGVNEAATYEYCDCLDRDTQLIAQDWALTVGWTAVQWLSVGAVTIFGLGAALAGRLVNISAAWRWVSYLIGAVLLAAVFLVLIGQDDIAELATAFTLGILVPIWAILLARGAPPLPAIAAFQDAAV
jgi:hypothetical protein